MNMHEYPFLNSGVDYGGPFKVQTARRRRQAPHMAYLYLFVCVSTKVVHLKCVMDLMTDSILGPLKRFVSRRGFCKHLFSNNGTNFTGANRNLRELYDFLNSKHKFIFSSLSLYKLLWNFNPPSAPHMGGLWEAAKIREAESNQLKYI